MQEKIDVMINEMKQILIVDDERDVREILRDFFKMQGYEVLVAEDGQNALDTFNSNKPDAAIVDIQMPVMDGIKFSKKILKKNRKFPIIMITGYVEKYSFDDLIGIGVKDVLKKPIDLHILKSKLQQWIN